MLSIGDLSEASADEERIPSFSIRDYVFRSRSKDVRTNWPFGPQSLELCLKPGVKDLLPPFEPPYLVRTNCVLKTVCSEKMAKLAELKPHDEASPSDGDSNSIGCLSQSWSVDKLVAGFSHQTHLLSPVKKRGNSGELIRNDTGNLPLVTSSDDQTEGHSSVTVKGSLAEEPSKVELVEPVQLPRKKRRLVVRFSSSLKTSRVEDIASNSTSAVSDAMGSKICPVCKTFSSTSNTTLNAHIDQCLSAEPDKKQVVTTFLKPKVVPRKKRLMVDIYAKAPRFTLEDLDRRNGSNWAAELALTIRRNEACNESQNLQPIARDSRGKETDGAVYVDSNGIKIRILSKFNDSPQPVMLRDESKFEPVCEKASKGIFTGKKHFGPKCLKKILKARGRKLGSHKILRTRIQQQGGSTGTHQKQKSSSELPESPDHSIFSSPSTLALVSSKHSGRSKELSKEDAYMTLENMTESRQTDLGDCPMNGQRTKTYMPFEEKDSSLETTGADFSSKMVQAADVEKKRTSKQLVSRFRWSSKPDSPLSGLPPKPSRLSGCLTSFPNGSTEETSSQVVHNSCNSDTRWNMRTEPWTSSIFRKNIEARSLSTSLLPQGADPTKKPALLKTHRQRSVVNSSEFREASSSVTQGTQASTRDLVGGIRHPRKKMRTPKSDISKRGLWSKTGHITDQVHPSHGNDTQESEQKEFQSKARDRENETSRSSPLAGQYHSAETPMQAKVSGSEGSVAVCSSDNVAADQMSTESINLENDKSAASEACQPLVQGSSEKNMSRRVRASCDNVVIEFREKKGLLAGHSSESQANMGSSSQESGACLDCHEDINLEIPQGGSSIASIKEVTSDCQRFGIVEEPLESLGLTASTMPPSTTDLRLNKSEPERINEESSNREAKVPQAKEGGEFSCRESHSGVSQFMQQSTIATDGSDVTSNGKPVAPRSYVLPRAVSSFGAYRNSSRTNMMTNSGLESPTQSVSSKASSECTANAQASFGAGSFSRPPPQNQIPSSSNPVLRLMGKNLMIVNKEEIGQLETPTPDYPIRFAPLNIVFKQNSQANNLGWPPIVNRPPSPTYHHHQVPRPDIRPPCFAPFRNGLLARPDQTSLQNQAFRRPAVVPQARGRLKDVILIDDHSPETMNIAPRVGLIIPNSAPVNMLTSDPVSPRPFSCFAPQNQFLPRVDVPAGARPVFPILYPVMNRSAESTFAGPRPFLLSPLVIQPPTNHLNPPVYYSQALR